MKVIIAGGREFTDYELLKRECDRILSGFTIDLVVSGCQRGADQLGEQYARERGYEIDRHPYLHGLGKAGGPIRNRKMALAADMAIVFWDGKSTGSKDMIDQMKRLNKPCCVIRYGDAVEPEQTRLLLE